MTRDELIERLEDIEANVTQGRWKLWGGEIRAPKPGRPDDEPEVGNSELVASFPLRTDRRPRCPTGTGGHVCDAYGVAELRNLLPEIIDRLKDRE